LDIELKIEANQLSTARKRTSNNIQKVRIFVIMKACSPTITKRIADKKVIRMMDMALLYNRGFTIIP